MAHSPFTDAYAHEEKGYRSPVTKKSEGGFYSGPRFMRSGRCLQLLEPSFVKEGNKEVRERGL